MVKVSRVRTCFLIRNAIIWDISLWVAQADIKLCFDSLEVDFILEAMRAQNWHPWLAAAVASAAAAPARCWTAPLG